MIISPDYKTVYFTINNKRIAYTINYNIVVADFRDVKNNIFNMYSDLAPFPIYIHYLELQYFPVMLHKYNVNCEISKYAILRYESTNYLCSLQNETVEYKIFDKFYLLGYTGLIYFSETIFNINFKKILIDNIETFKLRNSIGLANPSADSNTITLMLQNAKLAQMIQC